MNNREEYDLNKMKELLCGSCRWNFGGLCWFG